MNFERQLAWPCRDCGVRGSSFCGTLTEHAGADSPTPKNPIPQLFFGADEKTVVQESGTQFFPGPFVLCRGWAYRFYRFADGRRQILSVLIPGDLFSAFAVFTSHAPFSVQAATNAHICQFGRDGIKQEVAGNAAVREAFGRHCAAEVEETVTTSINLAARDAATRIVGFTRRLVERLAARGIRNGADRYPFPLDHTEIADATGLAPTQVEEEIHNLRARRILDLSNGEATIMDSRKFANPELAATG